MKNNLFERLRPNLKPILGVASDNKKPQLACAGGSKSQSPQGFHPFLGLTDGQALHFLTRADSLWQSKIAHAPDHDHPSDKPHQQPGYPHYGLIH